MSLSSDNLETVQDFSENWLFQLNNHNSTSLYLSYSDYDDGTNFYYGAIKKEITISESINLESHTATTSGFNLQIIDFDYQGNPISQELYGGSNQYQNQEIIVSARISSETIEIGRFRMMNISWDGNIVSINCQSARPWDFVQIPQDRDPSDVLIPLVYGLYYRTDTPNSSANPRYYSKIQPYLFRPIPVSPDLIMDDLQTNIVGLEDSLVSFYVAGYNFSKTSGSHQANSYQMSLYKYDQSLDAFIQLEVNSAFQDSLNGDLEIFDLQVNSRDVFYLFDSAVPTSVDKRLYATYKTKPLQITDVEGNASVLNLRNAIDLEQDTGATTPVAEPHDSNSAKISYSSIDANSSNSDMRKMLELTLPPFDGELLESDIDFSIYYTMGIDLPDPSMTMANMFIKYKWATSKPTWNSSGWTDIISYTGLSANATSETGLYINGVVFSNANSGTYENTGSLSKTHKLYLKMYTATTDFSGLPMNGYNSFFRLKDIRFKFVTGESLSKPQSFLYTTMRGEQASFTTTDTLSGSTNECMTGPEVHRDLLIRFGNMSGTTPTGWSDLNTSRNSNGWQIQYNTTKQVELKDLLKKIQREHAFIFRYKQGDISKPQYIFVKDSYSSGDYTVLSKDDISSPNLQVTPFSSLVTKLTLNHLYHPARKDYIRSTDSEIPNIRTQLNISSRENVKTINLETLIPTFSSVYPSYVESSGVTYTGTTINKSYGDYYLNLFGQPKLTIDFNLVNKKFNDLEVGDILQFDNDNMFPERPFGLASWSGINFMITDTRKKLGSIRIKARQI